MTTLTPEREAQLRDTLASPGLRQTAGWIACKEILAALDATRAELVEVRAGTSRMLDEARAAVDAAFADMKEQREQLHREHMAQLETLAASAARDARDLALLAEVRGQAPLMVHLMERLAVNAEREAGAAQNAQLEKLAYSSAQESRMWRLLVRLLRGEG